MEFKPSQPDPLSNLNQPGHSPGPGNYLNQPGPSPGPGNYLTPVILQNNINQGPRNPRHLKHIFKGKILLRKMNT